MFGKYSILYVLCVGKPQRDKRIFDDKQIKELAEALDNAEIWILFFVHKFLLTAEKISKRKNYLKLCQEYNAKEFAQIPSYKTAELESWIKHSRGKTKI